MIILKLDSVLELSENFQHIRSFSSFTWSHSRSKLYRFMISIEFEF